jgi:hypothetical protein
MAHSDTRKIVAVAVNTEAAHLGCPVSLMPFRIYQLAEL